MELPIDKNDLANQKIREIRDMEKNIIRSQYEQDKRAKEEKRNAVKAMERDYLIKNDQELKIMTQKQIQEKLQKVQEMNQFLIKQIETRQSKSKLDNEWRREGEKPLTNKYKDKVIRDKVNCQMCYKDY